ncbi:MAG: NTP transferase domain-containing protein [Flavobacteriaceae bacterium]|nr:NTP transferase domain-containing protein [Flavobacteriaceae bacterium]
MAKSRHLLIMAGGASSRMKKSLAQYDLDQSTLQIAQKHHKCLIPVGKNKLPLLYYHLLQAKRVGVTQVFIITPEKNQGFYDFLDQEYIKTAFTSISIKFIQQQLPAGAKKPLGTADAVQQALDKAPMLKEGSFVVMNGDNIYSVKSLEALFSLATTQNALIGYDQEGLNFSRERLQKFALLKVNKEGFLTAIVEKPSLETMNAARDSANKIRVSMNIFKLYGPIIYAFLENCPIDPIRKEKELPTAVQQFIHVNKEGFLLLPFCEHVPDLTSAQDIDLLNQLPL